MPVFKWLLGDDNIKTLKRAEPLVTAVNKLEDEISVLSDQTLAAKTTEFKERLARGESVNDLLPEAFAVVREAAKRTLKLRHFDVQLLGGIILHQGEIAEMKTGEGKTLVATLPAYLNALSGKGVHIVTVNDYLARRDAVWMGQIYACLELSVGVINNQASYLYDPNHSTREEDLARDETGSFRVVYEFLKPCARREAYQADITYGTNNEFGFDYLRDHIAQDPGQVVQRSSLSEDGYNYAIIDEVDSILIDESRTPLIISAPVGKSESLYQTFAGIAAELRPEEDYTVDEKQKAISLTDAGITRAEKILGIDNIYTDKGIKYVHHLETAVRAKALYERDRDYVVKEGGVVIVDEFTGRLQPGRRWSEGLHQAIEAKERVEVKEESRTFATITLQNYFRLYQKLAGMTGTALTSREEFLKVYQLNCVAIPTNKPSHRTDHTDLIFQTENGKFLAVARKVKELHQEGQPVLVGTVSIEKNELLSLYLKKEGVPHKVLNAKNHEEEGAIIAEAGERGSVVIATNMAGRGVDIKLGGATPTGEEHDEICALGGLYVLGTERHEARRIDNQLRGRSGRQGDPGETGFYVSLEDTLMRVFASQTIKNMMGRFGIPEDEPIESKMVARAIENAQEKIEGLNFDLRKHLLEYDDVMNHQRQTIYGRRQKILFGGAPEVDDFLNKTLELCYPDESERAAEWKKLEAKKNKPTAEHFAAVVRSIILQVIDMYWMEHLEALDYMRGSVRLRAYGQRDPLVEFKREGLRLFKEFEYAIAGNVLRLAVAVGEEVKTEEAVTMQAIHESTSQITADAQNETAATTARAAPKVGRNDPCPCGSGKKYKKCHGR